METNQYKVASQGENGLERIQINPFQKISHFLPSPENRLHPLTSKVIYSNFGSIRILFGRLKPVLTTINVVYLLVSQYSLQWSNINITLVIESSTRSTKSSALSYTQKSSEDFDWTTMTARIMVLIAPIRNTVVTPWLSYHYSYPPIKLQYSKDFPPGLSSRKTRLDSDRCYPGNSFLVSNLNVSFDTKYKL